MQTGRRGSGGAGTGSRRAVVVRRRRLAALGALAAVVAVAVVLATGGGGFEPATLPRPAFRANTVDPFAWAPGSDEALSARATAGVAHGLYVHSPGGVVATAARVNRWRGAIGRATNGSGVEPDTLEGMVFLESGGQPDVIAGGDPANAAGLTQILPSTATSMLHMHVDLARSRALTRRLQAALARGDARAVDRLARARRRADDRFVPAKALAGAVRYLRIARRTVDRDDLAVVSYHMGLGNLDGVLKAYGEGDVPYPRLFFDSAPDRNAGAWRRLAAFGDESSLYYWKVLAGEAIMRRWRADRAGLAAEERLHARSAAAALPRPAKPDLSPPPPLPSDPARYFLRYGGRVRAGTRVLRAPALAALLYAAGRTHEVAPRAGALTVTRASGWTFDVARRYASPAQARAFQFALDRLTVLHLIAWTRGANTIHVAVSGDAQRLVPLLDPAVRR